MLIVFLGLLILAAFGVENLLSSSSHKNGFLNVMSGVASNAFGEAVAPAIGMVSVWIGTRIGRPAIELKGGWYFLPSVVILVMAQDFLSYWYHRAEHRFPWLWAMHSFHHSDEDVNITTALRTFWFESLLIGLSLMPLGIVFRASDGLLISGYLATWVISFFNHMDTRVGFERFWWAAVSPQFHRIHHSQRREHYDRNFATVFPIWDLLFGTLYKPAKDEYPPTGLGTGESIRWWHGLVWPARHLAVGKVVATKEMQ